MQTSQAQASLLDVKPRRGRNTPLTGEQYQVVADRYRKIMASGLKPYDDELVQILNRSLHFHITLAQMKEARKRAGYSAYVARRTFEETIAVEKACGRDPLALLGGAMHEALKQENSALRKRVAELQAMIGHARDTMIAEAQLLRA